MTEKFTSHPNNTDDSHSQTRPGQSASFAGHQYAGLLLGLLAVIGFSVTLPATRLTTFYLDVNIVGPGRSLIAVLPALLYLLWSRPPLPTKQQLPSLLLVALTVVISFPWLTAIAMKSVSGAQGGIVVAVLPLFTAIAGALRLRQSPSMGFWIMAFAGSGLVLGYFVVTNDNFLNSDVFILLFASIICSIGYAEGARLSQSMGGAQVISWSIVLAAPFAAAALLYYWSPLLLHSSWPNVWSSLTSTLKTVPWSIWLSFLYLSIISQWLAFIFWYSGLAMGGVIRVSQTQLLQPFMTLTVSALLLNESINLLMILFATAVIFTVAIGRKMPINEARA